MSIISVCQDFKKSNRILRFPGLAYLFYIQSKRITQVSMVPEVNNQRFLVSVKQQILV